MGYTDLGVLVAFSGVVKDNVTGEIKEYTEANMNKFPDTETTDKFTSGEYQLLLVAEKYQTGFDQPLLHTMYVDKKLFGVKAVQTLSRINRTYPGKTETFILDFANSYEDIQKSFQDFYQETGIEETTDPNTIYDIKAGLDATMVYTENEINAFAKVFFKETKSQSNIDLGKLNSFIDPAVDRYNAMAGQQEKLDFRSALSKFIRLYSFLTHIINLGDENLYKFYAYAKCLLRKLPKDGVDRTPNLDSDVSLQYYRLQKAYEGSIHMENDDGTLKGKTSGTGAPPDDEKETLSQIIQKLNERLGMEFTGEDKVLEQIVQDLAHDPEMVLRSKNPIDLFRIIYDNAIMDVVLERMTKNQEFCERYLENEEYRREIDRLLLPLVHERLSKM
jgi:type I restriction enzyme R subunit